MSKYREFSSFNGLDRTAQVIGIPVQWAVVLMFLIIVTMLVGMSFYKVFGILFASVWLPAVLFLRHIGQTDDKALNILMLEFRFRMKRVAYEQLGNTLTFLPERYFRYQKTIEQDFTNFNETK